MPKKQFRIGISVVLYNTPSKYWQKCFESLTAITIPSKIFVIENSYNSSSCVIGSLKELKKYSHISWQHIKPAQNLGYGAGHNLALRESLRLNLPYHLVLNPDVYFKPGTIEKLYRFMEDNPRVGLVMPKIVFPNGEIQYLCKLLPTPWDLLIRRFLNFGPFRDYIERRQYIYELRFTKYNQTMEVPHLSGCFMFLRIEALRKVGLFDERFFMYMEDIDLCRRIRRYFMNIYYPKVEVYHFLGKSSYNNFKMLIAHIVSAIKYFHKWGWLNDEEREKINQETLKKLGYQA